ncbi:MAG: PAS domain-containing protein [Cyclobacteriaceae bacterium]|nr:PAS domain-containing protein [Cyclobacteriaceae bacterium]MCH8514897.1 PAS domain-containing protein [Cyclobacteriaceae bacterium]
MSSSHDKNKEKKFKGIGYYFRIDNKTIQGKITGAFMFLSLLCFIIIVINTYLWNIIGDEESKISNLLAPLKLNIESLENQLVQAEVLTFYEVQSMNNSSDLEVILNHRIPDLFKELDRLEAKANRELKETIFNHRKTTTAVFVRLRDLQKRSIRPDDNKQLQNLKAQKKQTQRSLLNITERQLKEHRERADYLRSNMWWYTFWEFFIAFILAALFASAILISILNRIRWLKYQIRKLGEGNLPDQLRNSSDELNSITEALNNMIDNLRIIIKFSGEVGKGNFNNDFKVFNDQGDIGKALADMRDSLNGVAQEADERQWVNEGITHFSDLMRKHSDNTRKLSEVLITELATYLQIELGALYLVEENDDKVELVLEGMYAFDRNKYKNLRIEPGQGLVGQAYLEQDVIHLEEIPENYSDITSAIGTSSPKSLLIVPLIAEEEVQAVLELASIRSFTSRQLAFVKRLANSAAATIASSRLNLETRELLEKSREDAEILRAQEEEMRQNAEELEATQEEIERRMREMDDQKGLYNSMIDNMEGILYRTNIQENNRFEFVSKHTEEMLGYSIEDILSGKIQFIDLVAEEDRKRVVTHIGGAIQNKGKFQLHFKMKRSDGQLIDILDKGNVVLDENGNAQYLVGFVSRTDF